MGSASAIHSLQHKVTDLQSRLSPSEHLVDTLNDLALELWRTDLLRALGVAWEARTLARLLNYHKGAVTSLVRLSWIHLQIGEFATAVLEAHEAKYFAERLEDYVLVLNALYTIAAAYQFAQEFKKAEVVWLEMLDIARAHKDRAREADYLVDLGIVYEDMGHYQAAFDMTLRGKDLYAKLNDNRLALALNNIAEILTKMGCHDEALSWAEESLTHLDPEWVVWWANFLLTKGAILVDQQEYALARPCLDESLKLNLMPGGRKHLAARALMEIATVELARNNIPAAIDALERAEDLAAEVNSRAVQADVQQAIARLHIRARDWDGADKYHDRYLGHKFRMGIERMEKQTSLMRLAAEVERQRPVWTQQSPCHA